MTYSNVGKSTLVNVGVKMAVLSDVFEPETTFFKYALSACAQRNHKQETAHLLGISPSCPFISKLLPKVTLTLLRTGPNEMYPTELSVVTFV